MNFNEIIESGINILINLGLSSTVILALVKKIMKTFSDEIEKRLEASFQLKLDKELEKYKATLEKRNYISKVRFDAEFSIYQELSEKHISVVYDAGEAVLLVRAATIGKADPGEITAHIEHFCKQLNDAEMTTKRYAPFISSDLYGKYRELDEKSIRIFNLLKTWNSFWTGAFPKSINVNSANGEVKRDVTQASTKQEMEAEQKELSSLSDSLLNTLRDYLSSLEVWEGK